MQKNRLTVTKLNQIRHRDSCEFQVVGHFHQEEPGSQVRHLPHNAVMPHAQPWDKYSYPISGANRHRSSTSTP